jgi:hypothetical protein
MYVDGEWISREGMLPTCRLHADVLVTFGHVAPPDTPAFLQVKIHNKEVILVVLPSAAGYQ